MEEDQNLSWQAKLAKSNINILDVHDETVFFEFTYHPKPGVFKWCKTVHHGVVHYNGVNPDINWDATALLLCDVVLELRKELEG